MRGVQIERSVDCCIVARVYLPGEIYGEAVIGETDYRLYLFEQW
jgi:hypothetical protein